MAELVDALGSGLSVRKDMGVQVPLRPPVKLMLLLNKAKVCVIKHAISACFMGLEKAVHIPLDTPLEP